MTTPASQSLKQLCVSLCMLLALVFAGTSAARVLDGIQHLPRGAVHHVHSSFGLATVAFADGHDADHHDAVDHDGDESDGSEEQPTHHHHADGGSGLIALAAADAPPMRAAPSRLAAPPQRLLLGLAPHGPERPPRSTRNIA